MGRLTKEIAGVRLSGLAGLYCYFLCLSYGWMAENGLAGWLIPSEFMDVNYGRQLKAFLLNRVTLLQVHRFNPEEVQFNDALVSSTVVWFKKTLPPSNYSVEFTYGGALTHPRGSKSVPVGVLRTTEKWSGFPSRTVKTTQDQGGVKLSDLFDVERGIATGANKFFVLTPEQVSQYQIPTECLWPILPSPRHVLIDEIEADAIGNPVIERRLFLLSCHLPSEEVRVKYPGLGAYLRLGLQVGIDKRYLCRHRSPWYLQEMRAPAPFLCTYMGRQNGRSGKPFRFILNHSRATVANVYLAMYPKPHLASALRDEPSLLLSVWKTLNAVPSNILMAIGRVYGGGLYKLEPHELGNVPVSDLIAILPSSCQKSVGIRASQLGFDW